MGPIASIISRGLDDLVRSEFESFRNGWFNWLLIWTAVVAAGLLFELPEIWHETVDAVRPLLSKPKGPEIAPWMKLLVALGWLLIVVGVSGEFVADSFVSKADGIVQAFDENLLADAQRKTSLANEFASGAFERAEQTEHEASQENERAAKAEQQAQQENERAASALEAAETARKKAEAFQLQIAQANERAASAEQRAGDAELELARIRTPRSLVNEPTLIAALAPFKGTEYTMNVFQDDESVQFTKVVDEVLTKAGWVRKQPGGVRLGIPSINVFSDDPKDSVPICLETGLHVHLQSKQSLDMLRSMPLQNLPKTIQAGIVFLSAFVSGVLPSDPRNVGQQVELDRQPGEGPLVVCVGKKP